jgi:hypothetical protein
MFLFVCLFKKRFPSQWGGFISFFTLQLKLKIAIFQLPMSVVVFFLARVSRHYLCGLQFHPPSDLQFTKDDLRSIFAPKKSIFAPKKINFRAKKSIFAPKKNQFSRQKNQFSRQKNQFSRQNKFVARTTLAAVHA